MLDDQARGLWDAAADEWNAFVEGGLDYYRTELHGPALLRECGDVQGREVVDLGAGQGWFSRELARRGARVVGVEWSPRLVEHARRLDRETPLGIRYEVADAAALASTVPPASADLVTACMSLMDMPRPDAVLRGVREVLRAGGRFVFSVPNPVTDSPYREWERDERGEKRALKLDRYFEAVAGLMSWNMPRLGRPFSTVQYRFTLEQWSMLLEGAGFVIARLREPRPEPAALARRPELHDASRMPYFLIVDARLA